VADASGLANVGIMMDTFHYYKSGISPDQVRAVPVERMFIVHVNDCKDLPFEELNDSHRIHCGQGILPLKEYLSALKAIGYEGYLSVEIFNSDYWADEPEKVVRETKEALDGVLATV
jgi:2-keto-myo-inositol isomerase